MNLFARLHDLCANRYRQVQHQLLNISQLHQRATADQAALLLLGRVLSRLFNSSSGQLILGGTAAARRLFAQLIAVQVQPLAIGAIPRKHTSLDALRDGRLADADQLSEGGLCRLLCQFNGRHNHKTSIETEG